MGSALSLDARASRAWVRRFARTTPGLVVLIAVVVATSCIVAGVVCAVHRSDLPLVDVPGGRVEYEDVPGDPALAPLLFLHEGLGSVRLWRGFHHRVAAATGRRTVAYSRLGHGGSDLPPAKRTPGYMHEEAAEVVPALCAALGLVRPALVGHSDGGSIALLHASRAGRDAAAAVPGEERR